ncbi:hypothetical protein BGW80DRAFT_1356837 [Lactifluus volemus]|nr:hypothetical protein BGW80DRAFT_1356837 [Lactifluus volemus]
MELIGGSKITLAFPEQGLRRRIMQSRIWRSLNILLSRTLASWLLFLLLHSKPLPLLFHVLCKLPKHVVYLPEHLRCKSFACNESPSLVQLSALDRHQVRRGDVRLADENATARRGGSRVNDQLNHLTQSLLLLDNQEGHTPVLWGAQRSGPI